MGDRKDESKTEGSASDPSSIPPRYQRNVGSLGVDGQHALGRSSVLIVGLGGLGGQVAEQLARAGVGRIFGVDPDIFDQTNLNRQILCLEDNLGMHKTQAAKLRLAKVNGDVQFTSHAGRFEELEENVYHDSDVVFDCLDNIEARLTLAANCRKANIPLVHGAIAGWYGEVGIAWPQSDMIEKIYRRQTHGIEAETGTPVFTAATAASLMVADGIKIITGKNTSRKDTLLFFDLLENEWETIALDGLD